MRSVVGVLARKFSLAMKRVVEPQITQYSLCPKTLTKEFLLFGLSFSHLKNIFHYKVWL